jgi:hypothetical protein
MGAIRFVEIAGKRLAEHDGKGDHMNPRWDAVYPAEEFDGNILPRCRIVARADEWEVGVTESGRILIGAGEGRVYSMPRDQAEKVLALLQTILEGNGP